MNHRDRPTAVVPGVTVLLFVSAAAVAQPLAVTHFAGPLGGPGLLDGTGNSSSFYLPSGIAVDGSGTVYVADTYNNVIRRVTAGGVVTTLAGNPTPGGVDGTGTAASFRYPFGIAVDPAGTLYVSDTMGHQIRKVTAGGVVTTLAGSGGCGFLDGQGTAASFCGPIGIVVDGGGNLVVADTGNHRIRRVTPGGAVTTVAGSGVTGSLDGMGTGATFNYPTGVAISGGNVFVADRSNYKIRRIAPDGSVTTYAGSGQVGPQDGTGTAARFYFPWAIAADGSGNLFVADTGQNKIRKIAPGAVVTTLAGSGSTSSADGTGSAAGFYTPTGVAADASGNVFVADSGNNKIRMISPSAVVTTLAGSGTTGTADGAAPAASFNSPTGVAADGAGNVYVADANTCKIRKIASRVVTTLAGSGFASSLDGTGAAATFYRPWGIAVDSSGNVYVAEYYGEKIRKVTPGGVVTTLAGSGSPGSADGTGSAASFYAPMGVAVDGAGNVYVADSQNHKIRKVTPGGAVTTVAGSGTPGFADGTGSAALFDTPAAIAVDAAGVLYVADANRRIRKVGPGGVVTTLAGSGAGTTTDGQGTAASFDNPSGLAVDASGNVWVAESRAHKIRKVTAAGLVTTVAGSGSIGSADGTGTAASFANPYGVAVDGSGNLYVADSANNAVRLARSMGSATCAPDDSHLCLLGGRFRVSADYTDYGGGHGSGKAVYLTPDTGYFWFFSAANVEVVPKMVSFCGGGSNNVAVYAGGLTDLGVTLHVTDTRSGTTKDYTNPLGTGFTLIRDGPFGCPAFVTDVSGWQGEPPPAVGFVDDRIVETTTWPEPDALVPGACTPTATTLCLLNGRFQVRAAYQDYGGHVGDGQAVPLTYDTGHFWFFGASNVETVVKMVSFCGGGTNNVGVYAGGLTDVQVTLTVTDVRTGLVKTYTNPLGTPFRLIRDGPFSCP